METNGLDGRRSHPRGRRAARRHTKSRRGSDQSEGDTTQRGGRSEALRATAPQGRGAGAHPRDPVARPRQPYAGGELLGITTAIAVRTPVVALILSLLLVLGLFVMNHNVLVPLLARELLHEGGPTASASSWQPWARGRSSAHRLWRRGQV